MTTVKAHSRSKWMPRLAGPLLVGWMLMLGGPALAQSGAADELTVLVPAEFPDIDPCETVSGDQSMLKYHIYSRLYTFNEKMEPQPDLVTGEKISDDGTTWTLQLRPGATFHDGTPVNAEAVKFTIDRMRDNKCGQTAIWSPIKEVRVDSDTQITFVTDGLFPALRNNLAHPDAAILDPTAVEKLGDSYGQQPVGSGPYKFVEWVTGDHITITRNDDYYGPKPFFKTITFKFIGDDTTRALLIDTGEADVALRVLPTDVQRLKANAALAVTPINGRNMIFPFNVTKPPFDDLRARQAANYAVDKQAIVDRVLLGAGTPAHSLVETVQYAVPVGYYEYDPAKARSLLEDAGLVGSKITLLTPTTRYPQDADVSQAVAGYLRDAGFDVNVKAMSDWPSYVDTVSHADFSLFLLGWGGSTGDPDNAFRRTLSCAFAGKLWNPGGYCNEEADKLIQEGGTEFDLQQRADAYSKFQTMVWNDAPWLFGYRAVTFIVHDAAIQDIKVLPGTEMPYFWEAHR